MTGIADLVGATPLLIVAVLGILLAAAGWMFEREHPARASLLRRSGYLCLIAAFLIATCLLARNLCNF